MDSPARPKYSLNAGGALAVLKGTTEQEALEPWVNRFLEKELTKFEGLKQIDELLSNDCIEPTRSPHSAPIVLVKINRVM